MLVQLGGCLVCLLFLFYIYLTWNNDYWMRQGIPYLEPQLLFGNIKPAVLMKQTVGELYRTIYQKLGGKPVGGFFKLREPVLMVSHPTLLKQLLVDDFHSFHDNDIHIRKDAEKILKMNPFLATGSNWKPLRWMLEEAVKGDRISVMVSTITPACKHMTKYISTNMDQPIDVQELSGMFATEVVASCGFGKETNPFSGDCQFRNITRRLFNAGLKSNLALLIALFAPTLSNYVNYRILGKKLGKVLTNIVFQVCNQRVKRNIKRNDFIQQLININKESQALGEGQVFKMEEIGAHCATFLINGYYPLAASIAFCLYELSRHSNIQTKVRQELLQVHGNPNNLTYEDLSKLKYLDLVIAETLRLHPAIQSMTRKCTETTSLSHDGIRYPIAKGTPVCVPIYALHMDEKRFAEPNAFIPERFLDPKLDRNSYLPFGAGPRICPGKDLSKMIIKMAVASVLSQFELDRWKEEDWPDYDESEDTVELDPHTPYLRTAKGGLWLRFSDISRQAVFYT